MMLAQPVSAGTSMIIPDRTGDLGNTYSWVTGEIQGKWGDKSPVGKTGYFDMVSVWFGQKGKTYTFGMQLAADLPQAGDALPEGITLVEWNLWISLDAWEPPAPVRDLFLIALKYDGSDYSTILLDCPTNTVIATPSFTIDGPTFEIEFSADTIGDLPSTVWLIPIVKVWWPGTFVNTDRADPGAMPGQVMWSIPWPEA
jgi:hypothetical protein